jgi:hypothetical protein
MDMKIKCKITRDRLCMYSNIKIFLDVVVGKLFLYICLSHIKPSYYVAVADRAERLQLANFDTVPAKEKCLYEDCFESRLLTKIAVTLFYATLTISFSVLNVNTFYLY